jgi:CRP/FNR family transcriptional regulator, cyclic AMP receptor protein
MLYVDLLARIPIFAALSQADREALAQRIKEKRCAAGQAVFTKGDDGQAMYIVESGAVQIYLPADGDQPQEPAIILKDVRAGDYFGELALFDAKPRSASAAAVVDTMLLELTRDEFADHLGTSKDAALTMLSDLANRLRDTNALLSHRVAKDAVAEFEQNLTWGQRLADRVAELNGSWAFILFLLGLSAAWALINAPFVQAVARRAGAGFDPYPYIFFNLLLAILVALQGPLIVMSQNRQSLKDRKQAETDFRVNLKNEVGIESIQRELAAFRAEALLRLGALEARGPGEASRASVSALHRP